MKRFGAFMVKALVAIFVLIIVATIVSGVIHFLTSIGFFENYSGWSEEEVITDTDIRATVKLPDDLPHPDTHAEDIQK